MRQLILVLMILLAGCGSKRSDSMNDVTMDGEIFADFIERFKSDSLFQADRVKFPLILAIWEIDGTRTTEKIEPADWRHLTLEYEEGYATRELDAYTQKASVFSDSAKIELRGVDNGIYIDYVFRKIDGLWFLTGERDYSN